MHDLLIFETHATSTDNEKGLASGHLDPTLSIKGQEQATALGKRYEKEEICLIYTSDLKRSFETAIIAFSHRDIPILRESSLREWNYGDYNGALSVHVEKLKIEHIKKPFPNGESLLDATKRISEFLSTIPRKKVLLIGHRALFYTLEHLSKKIPYEILLKQPWHWQEGWKYERPFFK